MKIDEDDLIGSLYLIPQIQDWSESDCLYFNKKVVENLRAITHKFDENPLACNDSTALLTMSQTLFCTVLAIKKRIERLQGFKL